MRLSTRRLALRELTSTDWEIVHYVRNDPRVLASVRSGGRSEDEVREWIEDCVVHDVASQSALGQYEYGITVSSGYGGSRVTSNVVIVNNVSESSEIGIEIPAERFRADSQAP